MFKPKTPVWMFLFTQEKVDWDKWKVNAQKNKSSSKRQFTSFWLSNLMLILLRGRNRKKNSPLPSEKKMLEGKVKLS